MVAPFAALRKYPRANGRSCLMVFGTRNAYLCGNVKVVEVNKRSTSSGSSSQRSKSRVYCVRNGTESTRICKTAFLRIHAVSNGRLERALKAQSEAGGLPHIDMRGHHEPGNKTAAADTQLVKEHIESFPVYRSHYSRADNPNKHYLSPDLSIAQMYILYKGKCTEDGVNPVSDWVYQKIFNEEFNLAFGRYDTLCFSLHSFSLAHACTHPYLSAASLPLFVPHTPLPSPPSLSHSHICTHLFFLCLPPVSLTHMYMCTLDVYRTQWTLSY